MTRTKRHDHTRLLGALCMFQAGLFAAACDKSTSQSTTGPAVDASPALTPQAVVPTPLPTDQVEASRTALPSNPFGLPPRQIKLDPGRRVFTFAEPMLTGAKLGSTLVLYAATVVGFDGDNLIIEGKGGPSYKVHPGYAIPVPDSPRIRPRDPVLTEWNGVMKHAVVTKFIKDRVAVRYTDMDSKMPEAQLKDARFVRQTEGLVPGNYAALKDASGYRHLLLVSSYADGAATRWLALGYGGAATLVDEAALLPIPIQPKMAVGATVWAEWVGGLRKATVQGIDDPGLLTVKFERSGRPVRVGWGLVMPPPPS